MVTTAPSIEMGLMLVQSALAAYFDERTGIETITGGFMHSFVCLKILII